MLIEFSYAAYLAAALGMTVWVARTLSTNGEIFLIDCFGHDEKLARSTNHLLVTGFYLVNIGFILLALLIVVALWESNRVYALVGMIAFFLIAGAGVGWTAVQWSRRQPRLFDASITELSKDRQDLTSGS